MKYKKITALVLGAAILLSVPASHSEIWATPSSKSEAEDELNDIENQMNNLEDQYSDIENELSEKAQELSELLAEQEILENDIAATQTAIDQAEVDLAIAKEKEAEEYEAMKLRIQYMYENSTQDSVVDAILNSNGIVDMLNRVEYVSQVHKADRDLMEDYKAAVEEVETLAVELETQMNDLLTLQEVSEHQEAELQTAMAALKSEAANYEEQITAAERRASDLADYIEEQNRLIEEQQRQLLLQQQKEEEERRQQQNAGSSSGSSSSSSNSSFGSSGYLTDSSSDPAFSSNVTGEELVNYALKFVGNPYKWGGNSLTNGCDCSGFVHLIYAHFGFDVPRQSQAFKTCGQAVSFSNIKAGDIVVYPGHVAIYIGNGKIVEAQSSKAGITCTRSVTCSKILAIRRVL